MEKLKTVNGIDYYLADSSAVDNIVEVDQQCFPSELRAPTNFFTKVITAFPDGTFLAMQGPAPVGYFCNMFVDDEYVKRLEEFLRSSPVLPVPKSRGKNLLHESIGITQRKQNIAKELILCTEGIIKRYGIKRLVAVLETPQGDNLTERLQFNTIKVVRTPVGESKIKTRSPDGFIELVREVL